MPEDFFQYQARATHIVDGDTLDVTVDLGFTIRQDMRLRLDGIDTAEIFGVKKESEQYQNGIAHKTYVEEWLEQAVEEWDGDWPIIVDTEKDEKGKYGRYVAELVRRSDGARLTEDLLAEFDTVEKVDY